jgi:hypothetical protein
MKRFIFGVVATALAASAGSAWAVPTFFEVQNDARFIQTGPSTTTTSGFDFVGAATPNDGIGPLDFDGGTITFPAASPLSTTPLSPSGVNLRYSSGLVNQATSQADYPVGTYTFHLTDSANPSHTQDEAVDNSIGTMPTTTPMLTPASFNGLQGMNSSQAFTVNWGSFADANATSLIFFAVLDSSNNVLVEDGLQPGVTQDTIPAGTLQAGQQYAVALLFGNFAITPDNNGEVIKENRTDAFFTTQAVPEPASVIGLALAGMFGLSRRRKVIL